MALSNYFTDEELESQLRLQFDEDKQWDIDFKTIFNQIEDLGDCFYLRFRGREFRIDKITGCVVDLNPKPEEEDEE